MNGRRIQSLALVLLLFLFFARCGGSSVGNPETVSLEVVGIDSSLSKLSSRALGSGLSVTMAKLSLGRIRFSPLEACLLDLERSETDFDFRGPFIVNLLTNIVIPDLGSAA